jgi:hypothetical protein
LFQGLSGKPVVAAFDEPATTSDGGALLLVGADRCLRLTERMAAALEDARDAGRVVHQKVDLLRQRVFGIACGYPDANDVSRVGSDPAMKLLLDRDPTTGPDLAAQPTLSRFENAHGVRELLRAGHVLLDSVLERHRRRLRGVRRVTIDLDVTEDPTHGAQQLALFNGFYRNWCYLPLLGFVTFDDEAEQYLVAAMLRPGNVPTISGARGMLLRIIRSIRRLFPRAVIRVRLDGGFMAGTLLTFLEEQGVEYVIGMPGNAVLYRRSRRLLGSARRACKEQGQTVPLYGETSYAARSWSRRKRRVVYKAEVLLHEGRSAKDNVRFVVTNLDQAPAELYALYCRRGDVENRIKELNNDVALGRTSCSSFLANQLRVLMAATAYALLQELRSRCARVGRQRLEVGTLRLRLLKIGARVVSSARRIVLHLAESHPWQSLWLSIARTCAPAPS